MHSLRTFALALILLICTPEWLEATPEVSRMDGLGEALECADHVLIASLTRVRDYSGADELPMLEVEFYSAEPIRSPWPVGLRGAFHAENTVMPRLQAGKIYLLMLKQSPAGMTLCPGFDAAVDLDSTVVWESTTMTTRQFINKLKSTGLLNEEGVGNEDK